MKMRRNCSRLPAMCSMDTLATRYRSISGRRVSNPLTEGSIRSLADCGSLPRSWALEEEVPQVIEDGTGPASPAYTQAYRSIRPPATRASCFKER